MPTLRPQHEAFCSHYLSYGNAADAARAAGYSHDSAAQQGYRLLRRPKVVARLAELRALVVARECQADAQLAKLEIAFGVALDKGQPAAAARIVETQTKLALLLGKAGVSTGEGLPPGAEPTRAALGRIAQQLGVPGPHND